MAENGPFYFSRLLSPGQGEACTIITANETVGAHVCKEGDETGER